MVLFGIILCFISFFILYQRLSFVLFGQSSTGTKLNGTLKIVIIILVLGIALLLFG